MTAAARQSPGNGSAPLPVSVLSGVLLLVGSALLGYGLGRLALVGTLPAEAMHTTPAPADQVPASAAAQTPAGTRAAPLAPQAAQPAWPALFGDVPDQQPAAPPPEPEPEPEPLAAPTLSDTYVLAGLVAGEGQAWALLRGRNGDELVRTGDRLPGGETVLRIGTDGVTLETPLGLMLVVFDDPDTALPRAGGATGADRP